MKTLTSGAQTQLATDLGTKPLNLIKIQWVPNGGLIGYADKVVSGYEAKIVSLGQIDSVIKVSDGGDSQSVNIVLSDIDGSLKNILDTVDVHKRPCWIYQWFEGTADSDKFLIMRGEISSPLTWDEGAQTVQFTVISQIESAEVGFSIEEGQFPLLPPSLIGVPWPMCFGKVINVPALRITVPREGTLAESFGIKDFTLNHRVALAQNICCPSVFHNGFQGQVGAIGAPTNPNPAGVTPSSFNNPGGISIAPVFGPDPDCVRNKCLTVERLKLERTQQSSFEFLKIRIFNGERFQQGREIMLKIGGAYIKGTFVGDVFNVTHHIHPGIVELGCHLAADPGQCAIDALIAKNKVSGTIASKCPDTVAIVDTTDCQADSLRKLNDHPTSSFVWLNAGEKVSYAYDEETVYIANIIPSTVIRVSAYRTLENSNRKLLTVPPDFYTTRTTNYGTYNVVEIVFDRSLSERGEAWEDDIFVTMESSVGPNTVDIMQFLISKYTSFAVDTASFNSVKAKLEKYPSHFPMLERKNITTMLQEMAFQSRCTIFLRDNIFFLKYLSESPTTVDTLNDDVIMQNTLKMTHTETEDLVTKFTAEWQDDYSSDKTKLLILRNNVSKYGVHEQRYNFYIYNIFELVHKSATFWTIRKSNTWKRLIFQTALTKLALEPNDAINLTLGDLSNDTIKGIVEKATYNPDDNSVDFEIWTPVRAGTRASYPWAYPSTVDAELIWPPENEILAGTIGSGAQAPGFLTIAPTGHPLSSNSTAINQPAGESFGGGGFTSGPDDCQPVGFGGTAGGGGSVGFCCAVKSSFAIDAVGGCDDHKSKPTDDARDIKPDPKTNQDNSGEVNTGKTPKFEDGRRPVEEELLDKANKALETATKARDVANAATEAAGGGGGAGAPDHQLPEENPFCALPTPGSVSIPKADPTDSRPVCVSTLTIASFAIEVINIGCGACAVPIVGSTVIEEMEIPGCSIGAGFPSPGASAFVDCCGVQSPTVFVTHITPVCSACAAPDASVAGKPTGYKRGNGVGGPSQCGDGRPSPLMPGYNPEHPVP